MKVLIVSGIWPPDVGGPASHAPELAEFLLGRGHSVEVVTTADAPPAKQPYEIRWVDRAAPAGVRHARVAAWIRERASHSDVVYATSMLGRAVLGSTLARRPVVVKLVADEAYERARRWGLFEGNLDAFQRFGGGLRVRALRQARDRALRRVAHLVCPSGYVAALAVSWGVPLERVTVLPNAAPALPSLPDREEARAQLDVEGPLLAFAGRITKQKALEVALDALGRVDGVALAIAGDGPDLPDIRRRVAELGLGGRVRFLGPLNRDGVLTLFRAADASLLTSSWENFPHTVVEALAVGTPVIATRVGGVPELVHDGENGLLIPSGDLDGLAAAVRRLIEEPGLRERLATAAAPSVEHLRPEVLYARLEAILREVAR
ncbi:MAG: glycosyltransferase family 4 protein [Actinobacteria bacterium]|nr:glycosyltransferase family 4 protein [Actinomycetota bacterium]